jgi:hypothetical protein
MQMTKASVVDKRKAENLEFKEDAGFPFGGMKQLNAISVNKDAVKMSMRLPSDFYDNETQDPSKPKPRSKT